MTSCASRRRPLLVALVVAGVGAFIPGTAPPLISRCPSAAATDGAAADGAAADGAAAAEIPEPLTPLERVQRAAQFWQKVVPALAGYGGLIAELQFRKQLLGPEWCLSDEECEVRWDDVHERSAVALAEACNDVRLHPFPPSPWDPPTQSSASPLFLLFFFLTL